MPHLGHRAPSHRRVLRWSLLAGGFAIALVMGGFAIAAAATSGTTPSTPRSGAGGLGPEGHGFVGSHGFPSGFGQGSGANLPAAAAASPSGSGRTVSAIGSGSITVSGPNGKTTTYMTTSSTSYSVDGLAATASAVSVGDNVIVGLPHSFPSWSSTGNTTTTTTPSTPTATSVDVVLPELSGKVNSTKSSSFTLVDSQGFWRTVNTTSNTAYFQSGVPAIDSVLAVGSQVTAIGTVSSDHTDLDASRVNVILPTETGKVTSVSGTTITLSSFSGTAATIDTIPSTVFTSNGSTGSLSDVKTGEFVSASGTKASNGTMTAVKVAVSSGGSSGGFPRSGPFAGPGSTTTS